ncbi:MAG: site-2 protease family protein, partial [Candidatus Xenobia bacterium]
YWIAAVLLTFGLFASIVLHEMAHSLMAQRWGIAIEGITLFIFGGVSRITEEASSPKVEWQIAIVGPLTSLVLAAVLWGVAGLVPVGLVHTGVVWLAITNLMLGLFNLVPGFPLDGGRLLRAFLWQRTGNEAEATRRASDWGQGVAWVLMALGALDIFGGSLIGGLWLIFIGLFLRGAAQASYTQFIMRHALTGITVGRAMIPNPLGIPAYVGVGEAIEEFFIRYGFRAFPVLEGHNPVGVITLDQVRNV